MKSADRNGKGHPMMCITTLCTLELGQNELTIKLVALDTNISKIMYFKFE